MRRRIRGEATANKAVESGTRVDRTIYSICNCQSSRYTCDAMEYKGVDWRPKLISTGKESSAELLVINCIPTICFHFVITLEWEMKSHSNFD